MEIIGNVPGMLFYACGALIKVRLYSESHVSNWVKFVHVAVTSRISFPKFG